MEDTVLPTCPVCHSRSCRESWQYNTYSIFECHDCDLQFAHPLRAASLEFYQTHYDGYIKDYLSGNIHPGYQFFVNKIRETVQLYLSGDQRRAIDVGCGSGYLLMDLQKNGFDCLGIDFNPDAIRVAREHFGIPAEVSTVEDLATRNERFDLAILNHVLEHVEDPMGLLRNISQILSPNGILAIDLPNRNYCRLGYLQRKGALSWGDYPPHHVTFWSVAALSNALKLAGYSLLECRPRPYPEAYQTQRSLIQRFNLRSDRWTLFLTRILEWGGRLAGLQGATIFAIARRNG